MMLIILMWPLFTNVFGKNRIPSWCRGIFYFFFLTNFSLGLISFSLAMYWEVWENGDLSYLVLAGLIVFWAFFREFSLAPEKGGFSVFKIVEGGSDSFNLRGEGFFG